MLYRKTTFSPRPFVDLCEKKLAIGKSALDWLVEAYYWSKDHLAEIQAHDPEFTPDWLKNRIIAVFNVNPATYALVLERFCGGNTALIARCQRIINQVGITPLTRANAMLLPSQKRGFISTLPLDCTPEMVREKTDNLYSEGAGKVEIRASAVHVHDIDYKREYRRLLAENRRLKKEILRLREEKALLSERVALVQ